MHLERCKDVLLHIGGVGPPRQRGQLGLTTHDVVALLLQRGRGTRVDPPAVREHRTQERRELVARGHRDQRSEIGRRLPALTLAGGIGADQGDERSGVREGAKVRGR